MGIFRGWQLLLFGLLCVSLAHTQEDDVMYDEEDFDSDVVEDYESEGEGGPGKKTAKRPIYKSPELKGYAFFSETFDNPSAIGKTWIESTAKKDDTDEDISKYDGIWSVEEPHNSPVLGDKGLVLKSKAKHHAIAANLKKPFEFKDKPFIIQYEVKFQEGQDCGGAYVKLLTEKTKPSLEQFYDKTPYTIMFGPDRCGNDNKLHFIFRHKNPVNGDFEEKHAKRPKSGIDTFFTDKKTHLFTLVVSPNNSFQVLVDQNEVNSGSLLEDMDPPVNPPKEIVDPNDRKPKDWDEREKISDPDAVKPDDWDESEPEKIEDQDAVKPDGWLDDETELIPDPDAEKPNDWDEDMDGQWEAPKISNPACEEAPGCGEWKRPQIKNPKYKGKWNAPLIDNPDYQGKWKPRMIPNPDYFEDNNPFKMTSIGAIGLELWSMSNDIYFDNFIITDNKDVADKWAEDTWAIKHEQEELTSPSAKSVVDAVADATKDRPWLWAVIILVVLLPLVLIIAYCCMPSSSSKVKGYIQWLLDSAQERKWLYGVYIGVVLLPFAVLSAWCCPNTGWGVKQSDIAHKKKTDAPSPDDDVVDDEGAGGTKPSKSSNSKKKASKSALEAEEDEADAEEDDSNEDQPKKSSPRRRKNKPQKE